MVSVYTQSLGHQQPLLHIVEGRGVIGEQKIEHLTLSCILNMLF